MLDQNFKEGAIVLIDKPYKWTSFDVVRYFSKIVGAKVGHAGTLDPLATGLLVLCTGKLTKQLSTMQADDKEYTGTFILGKSTPSFDLETEVDFSAAINHITEERIKNAASEFIGIQMQSAPLYSAKNIDGERAYYKARRGEKVEVKANEITIHSFDVIATTILEDVIKVQFMINCSKGTYIRAIARDFAIKLDTVGYLDELRRTRSGNFDIANAATMDDIKQKFKFEPKRVVEKQQNENSN
jgi:tRNA pseudouridine55 synthase